jgi:cytochrome c551
MMNKWTTTLCTLLVLTQMTACGGNKTNNPAGNTAGGGAAGGGTAAGGTATAADAQAIFKANCVGCHGDNLEGRMGGNSNLQQVGARRSREEISGRITNGGNGMPAFKGKLKDQEINALTDWLLTKK